jgi:NADH:ubiquinone reductase (H+-translocating)
MNEQKRKRIVILGGGFGGVYTALYLEKALGRGDDFEITLIKKVASSWAFDLFLPPDLVQLKLDNSMGISHEHFEPGSEVFHQGDLGDRLYIIAAGKAAVVREADGREVVLAQLGSGEYFGEMALLNQTTRNATVRCVEAMDVLSIDKREFGLLAANIPAMRESFEQVMKQRAPATQVRIASR